MKDCKSEQLSLEDDRVKWIRGDIINYIKASENSQFQCSKYCTYKSTQAIKINCDCSPNSVSTLKIFTKAINFHQTGMKQKPFTRSDKIGSYVRLMRPPNSITAGIAVIAAMFLALNEGDKPYDLTTYLAIAAAAFFVTAHAMVHNDIVDYEVDKVNSPERPLPSQIISLKEAKIWSIILFILAISSGMIIDYRISFAFPIATFWAVQNSLLLDAYNKWIKKSGLFGNLVVAYVVWALFIFADIVVSNKPTLRVESIGLYAFFMNWGREVIKGIRDIDGDRESGIKTIAVRFGPKGGAIGGSVLLLIAVAWTIPLILYPTGSITIPIILLIFDLVIIYRCIRLINTPTAAYANSTKRLFLYLMLIAVIALLIDQIILFV